MHRILNHHRRELGRLLQLTSQRRDQLSARSRCWLLPSSGLTTARRVQDNAPTAVDLYQRQLIGAEKMEQKNKVDKLRKRLLEKIQSHPERGWKRALLVHCAEQGVEPEFKKYQALSKIRKHRRTLLSKLKTYCIENVDDLPQDQLADLLFGARLEEEAASNEEMVRRALVERGLDATGARKEVNLRLVQSVVGHLKLKKAKQKQLKERLYKLNWARISRDPCREAGLLPMSE